MKTIILLLFFLILLVPRTSAQKPAWDSISVTILLKNKNITIDSVYVIFDKYDLTGAGVVKRIFYPSGNQIVIDKVPKGKYYVDVYCIGIAHHGYSKISTIGKRRSNKVTVPLKNYATYIPGTAVVSSSAIDLGNLLVTQKKFNK